MHPAISVFGLGYVGCVSAACFAKLGRNVVGVDVSQVKVDLINSGRSPIVEEGIGDLVRDMVEAGRLKATEDAREAVAETSISLVCVGTPSRKNGSLDLGYVRRVCEEIGAAVAEKDEWHLVVIRSTVLPGTIDEVVIPALESSSGREVPSGIGVCSNPEFLREGSSIRDFFAPPFTVVGTRDERSLEAIRELYGPIDAPFHDTGIGVAEMIKYASNCYHGLKVAFANEIGHLAKRLGVDSHDVMDLFCEDTKLNVSRAYLRPGFAFGGSCLPKDIRATVYKGREVDVDLPLLDSILESNDNQIRRTGQMVLDAGNRRIGVLGMSFKAGTDDLRESPMVRLIEFLIGKGMELAIFDRNVSEAGLMGANKRYIEEEIPHIWSLMRDDVDEVVSFGDTVIVAHGEEEFRTALESAGDDTVVIDLVRIGGDHAAAGRRYEGIAW